MPTDLGKVMENVAAIAMHMGRCQDKLERAHRAAAASINGLTGFHRVSMDMGIELESYARKNKIFWGKDADWILTTETLAETLLHFIIESKRLPHPDEREELVRASLTIS